jgi:hypothetical protein
MSQINARYRVIEDGAYAAPGTCFVCNRHGNSDELGMIDTQKDVDWIGVIYICSFCILEMAEQYGAASPSAQLNNLAAQEATQAQLYAVRERLAKAEGILDGMGALHLLDLDPGSLSSDHRLNQEVVKESETLDLGSTPIVVNTGAGTQFEVDESAIEQGPDDFFDTDDPNKPFSLDDL